MGRYIVWRPEDGEPDGTTVVLAVDAAEAATAWAHITDSLGDYSIVGGNDASVLVRDLDEPTEPTSWTVTGYMAREYAARPRKA